MLWMRMYFRIDLCPHWMTPHLLIKTNRLQRKNCYHPNIKLHQIMIVKNLLSAVGGI